jgi:hypothetical protein
LQYDQCIRRRELLVGLHGDLTGGSRLLDATVKPLKSR